MRGSGAMWLPGSDRGATTGAGNGRPGIGVDRVGTGSDSSRTMRGVRVIGPGSRGRDGGRTPVRGGGDGLDGGTGGTSESESSWSPWWWW